MPVYHGQLLTISPEETLRYAGLRKQQSFPPDRVTEACLTAQLLAVPRGAYEVFSYEPTKQIILTPQPIELQDSSITKHLEQSEKVALLAVTIGAAVEEKITELFQEGHYTAGLLLDAAATTAVEMLADQVDDQIKALAKNQGYITTWRFSPGYGNWDITVQPQLLAALSAHLLDLHTTESMMLTPRKSVTAVIGLKPYSGEPAAQRSCNNCPNKTCFARKEP